MQAYKRRWRLIEASIVGIIALLIGIIAYLNWAMAILAAIIVLAAYLSNYNTIHYKRRQAIEQLDALAKGATQASNFALQNLPMAMAIIDKQGVLVWNNSVFRDWLPVDWNKVQKLSSLIPGFRLDKIWGKSGFMKEMLGDKTYQIIYKFIAAGDPHRQGEPDNDEHAVMALYFQDITHQEDARRLAEESQPVWGMIQIDNIEDITKGLSDREYTNLWAEINNIVVDEIDQYDGFIRNFQDDMYIFAVSRSALAQWESIKFPVLEKIRRIPTPRQIPATISVGIAWDVSSVKSATEKSRAALDVALGRGGDQVCIMEGEATRFYGGSVQGAEKNTRVRARVVAQAIQELMNDSDKILVMGHEREDYDALGGAIGVVAIARALNKDVRLVISKDAKAIQKMMDALLQNDFWARTIITPVQALEWVDDNTLTFVCDVHRTDLVAAPQALVKSKRRVVIDHHRRATDFIESPLLTYLEPASSSTSELVTELLQYISVPAKLSKEEATGMYAGIVLDTKSFRIQTGVRTFEAAAFLRRAGADIDRVKKLFVENFNAVQLKAKMIFDAEQRESIVVTAAPVGVKDMMALSAQTADMLAATDGVEAAFVIYTIDEEELGISARSKGRLNVQLIMESLGGGGHRTVAGAQLQHMTIEDAKEAIFEKALQQLHILEEE